MATNGRPIGVTIVAVLAWINGAFGILGGILAFMNPLPGDDWTGWVRIILGIIIVIVSIGLFRGNTAARVITTIVFALSLLGNIVTLFSGVTPGVVIGVVISAAITIVGILLLYTKPANAFFAR
jgi:hypothetical protein